MIGDKKLREIARRHARDAIAPAGSCAHDWLQGGPHQGAVMQNIARTEEIIFYAMKEALEIAEIAAENAAEQAWKYGED